MHLISTDTTAQQFLKKIFDTILILNCSTRMQCRSGIVICYYGFTCCSLSKSFMHFGLKNCRSLNEWRVRQWFVWYSAMNCLFQIRMLHLLPSTQLVMHQEPHLQSEQRSASEDDWRIRWIQSFWYNPLLFSIKLLDARMREILSRNSIEFCRTEIAFLHSA